ncbi:hypothetical protein F5I97DRAFT_1896755 [Phlebopus sp. FC_14]|nr:hypothetical protein F5I97DRAFT_1896755 [Phlebopus sp. FC_14]
MLNRPDFQTLTSHVHRRDVLSDGGATKTIILVVSAVAGIVLLFFLFRFLLRLRGRNSRPLPPIQPIASQREQQLAELTERHNMAMAWFQPSSSPLSQGFLPSVSDTTLPQVKEVASGSSSERTSPPRPDSRYYLDIPRSTSPSSNSPDDFQMPNPSFGSRSRRNSGSSTGSTSSTPLSASLTSSWSRSIPRRSRPLSTVSTTSFRSNTNRSIINGVPHGPHSHVKIILPTPLAPALHPSAPGSSYGTVSPDSGRGNSLVRSSVVDLWTPTFHRSASSENIDIEQAFERSGNPTSSSPMSRLRTTSLNRSYLSPPSHNASSLAPRHASNRTLGEAFEECEIIDRGRSDSRPASLARPLQVSASPLRSSPPHPQAG